MCICYWNSHEFIQAYVWFLDQNQRSICFHYWRVVHPKRKYSIFHSHKFPIQLAKFFWEFGRSGKRSPQISNKKTVAISKYYVIWYSIQFFSVVFYRVYITLINILVLFSNIYLYHAICCPVLPRSCLNTCYVLK